MPVTVPPAASSPAIGLPSERMTCAFELTSSPPCVCASAPVMRTPQNGGDNGRANAFRSERIGDLALGGAVRGVEGREECLGRQLE